jgi:protein TonB
MNQRADAESLDRQLESVMAGVNVKSSSEWNELMAIAANVRKLPDPNFRRRLWGELLDDCGIHEPSHPQFEQVTSATAFASMLPTLIGDQSAVFPPDHRSFLVSFVSHTALIVLIASGIWAGGGKDVLKKAVEISQLTYLPTGDGGGGSGEHNPIPATKGTAPKMTEHQLVPPLIVVRKPDPVLPVQARVVGPPDLKLPQSNQIGDLISSNVAIPSNGSGDGGGAGNGSDTGLGTGPGMGYGPGSDRGFGGGPFRPGAGVTAPRAIYEPEPEYSEEARKIKQQGMVVLSVVVDQQGRPRNIHIARSLGLGLDEKAIEAVKKWKFTPGTKDGIPVAVQVNVEVSFRLY